MSKPYAAVLACWLGDNPAYRVATDAECGCASEIQEMNDWGSAPYHPYFAVGDFNGDDAKDFAVVVIPKAPGSLPTQMLIFNGPFAKNLARSPSYIERGRDIRNNWLFFGPPRPKPWILLYGQYATEVDYGYFPRGSTYEYREFPDHE